MSTLKADTLLHSSGNPATPLAIPSLDVRFATAWVNFNGTGVVAIRDAHNVASITDNAVGDYTINFSVALANVNYAPSGMARLVAAHNMIGVESTSELTTSLRVHTRNTTGANVDCEMVGVTVLGGQA